MSRASPATSASAVKGKSKKCPAPVGAPHATSNRRATATANSHRPESAHRTIPTTVSGQNGSKKPAAASRKVTAYIHRLDAVMARFLPHFDVPEFKEINRKSHIQCNKRLGFRALDMR